MGQGFFAATGHERHQRVLAQALCVAGGGSSECLDKGFTDGLECSSCVQLAKFGLEMLEADCRLCCTGDEESGEMKRYPSARLSICS